MGEMKMRGDVLCALGGRARGEVCVDSVTGEVMTLWEGEGLCEEVGKEGVDHRSGTKTYG